MHEHEAESREQIPLTAFSSIPTMQPIQDAADRAYRVSMKHKQNIYERRYRAKKRNQLLQARSMWLSLEFELYDLILEASAAVTFDRKEAYTLRRRYDRLLRLRQAILRDTVLIRSVFTWSVVLHLRNLTAETTMITHNAWEAMERQVLGVVPNKPFRIPLLQFSW